MLDFIELNDWKFSPAVSSATTSTLVTDAKEVHSTATRMLASADETAKIERTSFCRTKTKLGH